MLSIKHDSFMSEAQCQVWLNVFNNTKCRRSCLKYTKLKRKYWMSDMWSPCCRTWGSCGKPVLRACIMNWPLASPPPLVSLHVKSATGTGGGRSHNEKRYKTYLISPIMQDPLTRNPSAYIPLVSSFLRSLCSFIVHSISWRVQDNLSILSNTFFRHLHLHIQYYLIISTLTSTQILFP